MRIVLLLLLLIPSLLVSNAFADDQLQEVQIVDPYLDMHTGPGSGYPIFNVVERGDWISILKRQTNWFKIRTKKGKEGWVVREQMEQTMTASGAQTEFKDVTQESISERHWEIGMTGGQFGDIPVLSIYGGFAFSSNLSTELTLSQALGTISSRTMIEISLVSQPFPEWRFSPFFSLGTGYTELKSKGTLIQPKDKNDQYSKLGLGLRTYLTRSFIARIEYNAYTIYSASNENDKNEDVQEWKVGFTVFF